MRFFLEVHWSLGRAVGLPPAWITTAAQTLPSVLSLQRIPADQRNGDGEAKCPAGRARVCPTVLHAPEPGPRLPAQVTPPPAVWPPRLVDVFGCPDRLALSLRLQVLREELVVRAWRCGRQRQTAGAGLWTVGKTVEA